MKRFIAALALSVMFAGAATAALPFSDGFENGMGNWTKFPGAADALQHWDNDIWKNKTPGGDASAYQPQYVGGGNGFSSYHNFGPTSGFVRAEAWIFEDYTSTQNPIQGAITLTAQNANGEPDFAEFLRIGVLQFSGSNTYYSVRTAAQGFQVTNVPRKAGFTHLAIEADPGIGSQVRFYIDGVQVATSTRSVQDIAAIQVGQNFSNYENFWYDDVLVTPEPASLALLGLGGLVLIRRRRH